MYFAYFFPIHTITLLILNKRSRLFAPYFAVLYHWMIFDFTFVRGHLDGVIYMDKTATVRFLNVFVFSSVLMIFVFGSVLCDQFVITVCEIIRCLLSTSLRSKFLASIRTHKNIQNPCFFDVT